MMKTNLLIALCLVLISPFCLSAEEFHDPTACETATTISCGTVLNDQTNAGYTNRLDNYACDGNPLIGGYNGSERIYRLNVNTRQVYTFRLDDVAYPELNFDMFLMQFSCEAGNCIASSTRTQNTPEVISTQLDPGIYYLVIDTWVGESGTFDLSVSCNPIPQPISCYEAKGIQCGVQIDGNTNDADNTYNASMYDCYYDYDTYNGGDDIYAFYKANSSDHVQIHLITEVEGLNIILVSDCDKSGFSCVLTGEDFGEGKYIDERDYGLPAGSYYVIVDGRSVRDHGAYSLIVNCGEAPGDADLLDCDGLRKNEDLADGYNRRSVYDCGSKVGGPRYGLVASERRYYFDVTRPKEITIKVEDVGLKDGLEVFLFSGVETFTNCFSIGQRQGKDIIIRERLEPGRYIVVVDGKRNGKYNIDMYGCECIPDGVLQCDVPINDNNEGGENNVTQIGDNCRDYPLKTNAQDKVYEFVAPQSQYYLFLLRDLQKDLDLFLMRDCTDPNSCLGISTKEKTGDEYIRIYLEKGEIVYALVDSWAGLVTSDYTLTVSCTEDLDLDGIPDSDDNCPTIANTDQLDTDADGLGNVCDLDDDNDGVPDTEDCDPLDDAITYRVGDACDDNDPETINDVINGDCNCVGERDSDRDGIADLVDQCPNTPLGATVNAQGCADADDDGFFPGAVGALNDPDDNDPCVPDDSSIECQGVGVNPIQLTVENGKGFLGDTVCVDIVATDFTNVAGASFSITIDNDLARFVSINNVGLAGGTFTGSISYLGGGTGSGGQMTGSGSGSSGFVVWTANPGQSLSLGPITPIVEVCVEIVTDTLDQAVIAIDGSIKDVEFFDINADPYDFELGDGTIYRDTTGAGSGATQLISGAIVNIADESVGGVLVSLSGSMEAEMTTATDGNYAFNVPAQGAYSVAPAMLDSEMEDVSIMDILIFRKHFIYKESFTHPYQYIAADIDGNGQLSIRDELLMKNMIFGIDNRAYPYWTFVKSDYDFGEIPAFTMKGEVFDYPSSVFVDNLTEDMLQNFVAVRKGDLDITSTLSSTRSSTSYDFLVEDKFLKPQSSATMELQMQEPLNLAGMMLVLEVSSDVNVREISVDSDGLTLDYNRRPDGTWMIAVISQELSTYIPRGEILLTLSLDVHRRTLLSEAVSISSLVLPSEVVDKNLDARPVELKFNRSDFGQTQVSLYPNPVSLETTLEVLSAQRFDNAMLKIYDATGRVLTTRQVSIGIGRNLITMSREDWLVDRGVVYYDLSLGMESHQGKIIVVH